MATKKDGVVILDTKNRNLHPVDDKYFSKVVGKALEILELVKTSSKPLSLNEATNHIGMAKSSVFRILHTLEVAGYITKDDSGHYSLSTAVRPWVSRYFVDELVEAAMPRMWELRRRFSETVSMGVLFDNHIEIVAVVESPKLIRMGNTVGRIIPPHASSIGKSIAAFQSETRKEELLRSYGLARLTPRTITDEIELKAEFERIRKEGVSFDREETTEMGSCVGVPLFIRDQVLASMSLSIPNSRMPENEALDRIIKALKAKAAEIAKVFKA